MKKIRASDWLSYLLVGVIFAGLIGVGIWWEMGLWSECRSIHSFFYCMRILSN